MKRLLLAACLCIGAFVVAPVTSASASTFAGACVIKGEAKFGGKLSTTKPVKQSYTFSGEATVCVKLSTEELKAIVAKLEECKVGGVPEKQKCLEEVVAKIKTLAESTVVLGGKAEVSGEGELACAAAIGGFAPTIPGTGLPGKGKIEVGAATSKFEFKFVAQGGIVDFAATPEGEPGGAVGLATFLQDQTGVTECAGAGPEHLEFDAVTAGVI